MSKSCIEKVQDLIELIPDGEKLKSDLQGWKSTVFLELPESNGHLYREVAEILNEHIPNEMNDWQRAVYESWTEKPASPKEADLPVPSIPASGPVFDDRPVTIQMHAGFQGYSIYDSAGESVGQFSDTQTAAAHHSWAIVELARTREALKQLDHVVRNGIAVRIDDQWPALKSLLESAIETADKLLRNQS